ncbi:hypothetical protein ECG_01666 [Echinococcus granulosus]|uniref:Expressed conserved protein n=1 Tax=Echinococcus granulosus TaxID=6210 RepID=A0A068WAH7_ECHGR|nr:hypothetical protein ECG_01666 [Echinococcus granulosus]CDS15394.1 expressed conserved protein [Echinococcus granulosus]
MEPRRFCVVMSLLSGLVFGRSPEPYCMVLFKLVAFLSTIFKPLCHLWKIYMAASDRSVLERCLGVYFKSIDKLKENIKTLYESYYLLIKDKIDCETGDRLTVNSQNFNKALLDALNRCDELETQLLSFESWIDLPIVNPADPSSNFDDVSDDAHRLIDILQQVQSALLSAVSKDALRDALPERQSMKALKMEHSSQPQRIHQTLRTHMLPQHYQAQQPEMAEVSANSSSVLTAFTQDDQSAPPINDGPSLLGAPNPALSTPQHPFTPQKPQARRIYSDAPSPYNQHQPFAMNRTGSDPNLIGQQQFMQHQESLSGIHMQGVPPHSLQPSNNPAPYGF